MTKDFNKKKILAAAICIVSCFLLVFLLSGMTFTNNVEAKQVQMQQTVTQPQQGQIETKQVEKKEQVTEKKEEEIVAPAKEIAAVETTGNGEIYEVTAYDLSVQSCGKRPSHPAYGITASGRSLRGQSLETARAIAVDPNVIPLGTKVKITFKNPHFQNLNGVYEAVDTGGGVRGNHIDLFVGDFQQESASDRAINFGRQIAKVEIL